MNKSKPITSEPIKGLEYDPLSHLSRSQRREVERKARKKNRKR